MIAAFFDIDGTVHRNSLLTEHFKKLLQYELIDLSSYNNEVQKAYKLWDERIGDYDKYLFELTTAYVDAIKNVPLKDNHFVSDQVVLLKGNKVYKYTRSMIEHHKKMGHLVIFISGSPDFLISRIAEKFNADDYQASIYHTTDDNFSGEISPMWDSQHKTEAMLKFKEKYDIDFDSSYAYGDTNGDFSMLSMVGNPRAINPSRELVMRIKSDKELAKKAEIIIERKDVIYKLKPDVEIL